MESVVLLHKKRALLYDGERLNAIDLKKAKRYRVGAAIDIADIIAFPFRLPLTVPKEQLDIQVELKMYNEGGLDPNKEYKIDYIAYPHEQEKSYIVEGFAVEDSVLEEKFGEMASAIGYIDTIFPRFIAYKALYQGEIPKEGVHLFLYLSPSESFGAFYKDGMFIGYRALDSLQKIAQQSGIELARIESYLKEKGFIEERYTPEEIHIFDKLQEFFYKNVEKLIYAINYKRSFFGFETIDRIYIDFEGDTIDGLLKFFYSFGMEKIDYKEVSCCKKSGKETSLLIQARYIQLSSGLDQTLNFSIFERKAPLFSYESAKVATALIAMVALGVGAYGYFWKEEAKMEHLLQSKQALLSQEKRESQKIAHKLKALQKRKKELQTKIASLRKEIGVYQTTLDTIPFIQQSLFDRERVINDIIEALYRYRLSTKSIEQNGTRATDIVIISDSDQREKIAKFMHALYQKHYSSVTTHKILYEKGVYESKVRIYR